MQEHLRDQRGLRDRRLRLRRNMWYAEAGQWRDLLERRRVLERQLRELAMLRLSLVPVLPGLLGDRGHLRQHRRQRRPVVRNQHVLSGRELWRLHAGVELQHGQRLHRRNHLVRYRTLGMHEDRQQEQRHPMRRPDLFGQHTIQRRLLQRRNLPGPDHLVMCLRLQRQRLPEPETCRNRVLGVVGMSVRRVRLVQLRGQLRVRDLRNPGGGLLHDRRMQVWLLLCRPDQLPAAEIARQLVQHVRRMLVRLLQHGRNLRHGLRSEQGRRLLRRR